MEEPTDQSIAQAPLGQSQAGKGLLARMKALPTWIQTASALVALVFPVLAFFGITGANGGPRITHDGTIVTNQAIDMTGTYRGLQASETVVVIVRVATDTDSVWVTAEADRTPDSDSEAEPEAGTWEASVPAEGDQHEVVAAIIPSRASGGFEGGLSSIRESGPEADVVIEATEVEVVEP